MGRKTAITSVFVALFVVATLGLFTSRTPANASPGDPHYMPQYTASGEMILPPYNIWREWVYVGSPLTPNGLNGGKAVLAKKLTRVLHPTFLDDSQKEPSGRGYFKLLPQDLTTSVQIASQTVADTLSIARLAEFLCMSLLPQKDAGTPLLIMRFLGSCVLIYRGQVAWNNFGSQK